MQAVLNTVSNNFCILCIILPYFHPTGQIAEYDKISKYFHGRHIVLTNCTTDLPSWCLVAGSSRLTLMLSTSSPLYVTMVLSIQSVSLRGVLFFSVIWPHAQGYRILLIFSLMYQFFISHYVDTQYVLYNTKSQVPLITLYRKE